MLIAEIRRKLIDLEDVDPEDVDVVSQVRRLLSSAKEDLLTADVFGGLRYLPSAPYLKSVLSAVVAGNSACAALGEQVGSLDFAREQFEFTFWPTYRNPPSFPGQATEPDVELTAPGMRIFFEAKLGSGFGELQIPRQLLIGLDRPDKLNFFLVLVTAGLRPPRIRLGERRLDVRQYLQAVASSPELNLPGDSKAQLRAGADRIAWISWRQIAAAIDRAHAEASHGGSHSPAVRAGLSNMVGDLRVLLEMRGLAPFKGIGQGGADAANVPKPIGCLFPSPVKRCNLATLLARYMPIGIPGHWMRHGNLRRDLSKGLAMLIARHPLPVYVRIGLPSPETVGWSATAVRLRRVVARADFDRTSVRLTPRGQRT